ncbi:MarR family winged helix-turn-helix transcriptional regulator [uncultured Fibrella sp.]|uniref:MarR family winged helix-turn-helix transcriptional regulator n=1 Tax=uncultured Fibrella sp. TaxID=1284596 RepID=UPI0035CC4153
MSNHAEDTGSYVPLIQQWEEYIRATGNRSLDHFGLWLLSSRQQERQDKPALNDPALARYFKGNTDQHGYGYRSSEAAYLIWRLNKFVRFYTKPIFQEMGLSGQDDFALLAHLDYQPDCPKKEAIQANIIDATTGIEIIRRLVKQGLVAERPNPADKREKLITLTPVGRDTLHETYRRFAAIQDLLVDLSQQERDELMATLKSLDEFHTTNHSNLIR